MDPHLTDVRDREHIIVHLRGDRTALFLGKPVIGRVSGRWSIQLSRSIFDTDSKLTGILVASIDPFQFEQIWQKARIRSGVIVDVFGNDGVVRSSSNSLLEKLTTRHENREVLADARKRESGLVVGSDPGGTHLTYFSRNDEFGFLATASYDSSAFAKDLSAIRSRYAHDTVLFTTLIALMGIAVVFAISGHTRAEEARNDLVNALNAIPVGVTRSTPVARSLS